MRMGLQALIVLLLAALLLEGLATHRALVDLRQELHRIDEVVDRAMSQQAIDQARPFVQPEIPVQVWRQLIREELQAFGTARIDPPFDPDREWINRASADTRSTQLPISPLEQETAESALQHNLVHEEIDLYIDRGRISNAEMAVLQSEIARLAPTERVQAMRRLVAAINAGDLQGRL